MKRLLIASLIVATPFLTSCDNRGDLQEEQTGAVQTEQLVNEGEVIESETAVIERQPAELQQREVEKGSEEVQYTTKRQVTETVLREQNIPTIQICQSKANINEMDQAAFRALGFDQQSAQKIVQAREQRGSFKSVDELSQIQGISQSSFSQVKNDLGVAPRQAQEE